MEEEMQVLTKLGTILIARTHFTRKIQKNRKKFNKLHFMHLQFYHDV